MAYICLFLSGSVTLCLCTPAKTLSHQMFVFAHYLRHENVTLLLPRYVCAYLATVKCQETMFEINSPTSSPTAQVINCICYIKGVVRD